MTGQILRLPGKVLGVLGRLVARLGDSPEKTLGNRVLAVTSLKAVARANFKYWLKAQNSLGSTDPFASLSLLGLDPEVKESQDEDWIIQLLRCMTSNEALWHERYEVVSLPGNHIFIVTRPVYWLICSSIDVTQ